MRFVPLAILLVLSLDGCATDRANDVVDRVAQALAKDQADAAAKGYYRMFPYPLNIDVFLPSNAPPAEVAKEALKQDDWFAYASTNFTVLTIRKVRICGYQELEKVADPFYTAVLVNTALGQRVVLLQFHDAGDSFPMRGFWMHKTYDPDRLLNKPHSANSRHQSQRIIRTPDLAAIADAKR